MLKTVNVTKAYGSIQVLKGINLDIAEGEIVSITGASGAGKSTLLQILGTLDVPDSGQLFLKGEDPAGLSGKKLARFRNRNIGFIFQFHNLLPEFTAVENVMIPALLAGESERNAKTAAIKLLERLGLGHRLEHKPAQLSGGEQQRTSVARTLINRPAIVLADEPSGNLDSINAAHLHNLFLELRKEFNQTFAIVTHNEDLASLADRKLVMRDGNFID